MSLLICWLGHSFENICSYLDLMSLKVCSNFNNSECCTVQSCIFHILERKGHLTLYLAAKVRSWASGPILQLKWHDYLPSEDTYLQAKWSCRLTLLWTGLSIKLFQLLLSANPSRTHLDVPFIQGNRKTPDFTLQTRLVVLHFSVAQCIPQCKHYTRFQAWKF